MPRTTIDIDASVLRQVKRLAQTQSKTLTQVVSELLAAALAGSEPAMQAPALVWRTQRMGARIDLEDKEAVAGALDRSR